jgi:hypothetical protein
VAIRGPRVRPRVPPHRCPGPRPPPGPSRHLVPRRRAGARIRGRALRPLPGPNRRLAPQRRAGARIRDRARSHVAPGRPRGTTPARSNSSTRSRRAPSTSSPRLGHGQPHGPTRHHAPADDRGGAGSGAWATRGRSGVPLGDHAPGSGPGARLPSRMNAQGRPRSEALSNGGTQAGPSQISFR